MNTIPNRLREHRERKGLTQVQVAQYLGLKSSSRIAKWEKGVLYPHVRNFVRLLELYGITADEVYKNEPSIN